MPHVMYPAVAEIIMSEMAIRSFIKDTFDVSIKSDDCICLMHLPFVVDMLNEMYTVTVNHEDALNLTANELAVLTQRRVNDQIHRRVIHIIDSVVSVNVETVYPFTKIVDDLSIDSISLSRIGTDLEDAFDIVIPDEKLRDFKMIGNLERYIKLQLIAKQ